MGEEKENSGIFCQSKNRRKMPNDVANRENRIVNWQWQKLRNSLVCTADPKSSGVSGNRHLLKWKGGLS